MKQIMHFQKPAKQIERQSKTLIGQCGAGWWVCDPTTEMLKQEACHDFQAILSCFKNKNLFQKQKQKPHQTLWILWDEKTNALEM